MSFTLKRGLDNIYAAEVTEDSATAFTTGTPFHLIPAGEMSVTVDNESTEFYFDNTVFAEVGREGSSELTITGAGLRAAAIANLNGKSVDSTTGAVIDDGNYHVKYYALGARKKNIDGTFEMFWFAKGTFKIPDESAKTEDDSTDASGNELTYTAIRTTHLFNGNTHKRVIIDTETTAVKSGEDWFAQVVTPDNLSEIVEAVSATNDETDATNDETT